MLNDYSILSIFIPVIALIFTIYTYTKNRKILKVKKTLELYEKFLNIDFYVYIYILLYGE